MTLTFDLLILKVVSESDVTWATSVPILVFLALSVLDLGPMYVTESARCQTPNVTQHHRLMPPPGGQAGHNNLRIADVCYSTGLPLSRQRNTLLFYRCFYFLFFTNHRRSRNFATRLGYRPSWNRSPAVPLFAFNALCSEKYIVDKN